MISYFSQGFLLGVGSQMLLLYLFPNAYQNLFIHGFYTLVHTYTTMNYYYGKHMRLNLLTNETNETNENKNTVSIVKKGKSYIVKEARKIDTPFDFLLHSLYSRKDSIFYKIISYDVNEDNLHYDPCSFKFMNVTVTLLNHGGKSYSIHLSSPTYSYYVVDNIINVDVICYLLYEHYGLEFTSETLEYQLDFIDHEVKLKTIGNKEAILFNKDDYHILYDDIDENDYYNENYLNGDDNSDDNSDANSDSSLPDLIECYNE
jgi:hypothetical protein